MFLPIQTKVPWMSVYEAYDLVNYIYITLYITPLSFLNTQKETNLNYC